MCCKVALMPFVLSLELLPCTSSFRVFWWFKIAGEPKCESLWTKHFSLPMFSQSDCSTSAHISEYQAQISHFSQTGNCSISKQLFPWLWICKPRHFCRWHWVIMVYFWDLMNNSEIEKYLFKFSFGETFGKFWRWDTRPQLTLTQTSGGNECDGVASHSLPTLWKQLDLSSRLSLVQ